MTTESPERLAFEANRTALIKILGNKALYDTTINKAGSKLFAAWGGCYSSDRVKLKPYHYYVINVDTHDKPGSHWLACYTSGKRAYVWDSYSRPIKKLAPQLVKTIHKAKMSLGKTNRIPQHEQIGYTSEVCGVLSLAWLLTVRDLGIALARNI